MSEVRRCEYCDQGTTNTPERIKNRRVWVCNNIECQQEFVEEKEEARDADRRYDDWVTRSE